MRTDSNARENLLAAAVYILLILAVYSPVAFGGKSLHPGLYQPHGLTSGSTYADSPRRPVNAFNVDIGTPAYYEFPVNALVGGIYAGAGLPLWNPYQAAGTPLAAQYSSRAFFPYQIIEDLSPVPLWDLFLLGRLFIAGFVTFLFLRRVGLSFVPSLSGGLLYMLSGVFTWFINLEQLVNTAMVIPLVLYATERLARVPEEGADAEGERRRRWARGLVEVSLAGLSFGLLLLAGQPEVALYATLLAFSFLVYRTVRLFGVPELLKSVPRFGASYASGLGLAAPLIFVFLELVGLSYHIHPPGGLLGVQGLGNWRSVFAYMTPSATEFPAHPEMLIGLNLLVNLEGEFFRFLPINGIWDTLGGYTGSLAAYAVLAGILYSFTKRGRGYGRRGELIFFAAFAAFIVLKNFGVRPFVWLGALPLFDQVWSQRWAGPVWIFAFSAAAAFAIEALKSGVTEVTEGETAGRYHGLRGPALAAFVLLAGVYVLVPFVPTVLMALNPEEFFSVGMRPFVGPSMLSASVATLVVLASAFGMLFFAGSGRSVPMGLAALAAAELWWAVPRFYGPDFLVYKWGPFLLAISAAWALYLGRRRAACALAAAFALAFFILDASSPRGFPPREDPYEEAGFMNMIKEDPGRYRAAGFYGALFPNYASAAGVMDVHYVNSLVTSAYHEFRKRYLHAEVFDEGPASVLWFTGRPERSREKTSDEWQEKGGRGAVYEFRSNPAAADLFDRLRGYSLLGVKYLVVPAGYGGDEAEIRLFRIRKKDGERLFPAVYEDGAVEVLENPYALPRAFVAGGLEYAESYEAAQARAMDSSFDIKRRAVVEEKFKDFEKFSEGDGGGGPAEITSYGANSVTVEVETTGPGLLVLTDVFYPGWRATVNGRPEKIYRADGLVRGVRVGEGRSTVVFTYSPGSFRAGALVFVVTIIALICMSIKGMLVLRS